MTSMIRFDHVDLGYGRRPILQDVNCLIDSGDAVGLVGPNGAGKTTFLRGVLGLLKPLLGTLSVDRSKHFAYVPQTDETSRHWPLTVEQVVWLANKSKRLFGRVTSEEVRAVKEAMVKTGIESIADRRFSQISGGQRQRAILAQALSQQPDVLLLDEPTRGLDVAVEREFLSLVRKLRSEKKLTILIVTHTLQIPLNFTEKILVIKGGGVVSTNPDELVQTDKLEEIYGIPFYKGEKDGVRWVNPKEL